MPPVQTPLFAGDVLPRVERAFQYTPAVARRPIRPFMCDEDRWDVKTGKEVKDYLVERTTENPYFAVVSAVMHAGTITYGPQQQFVERIAAQPPETFLSPENAKRAMVAPNGKSAQFPQTRAVMLPYATKCYLRHCGGAGKKCLKHQGREKLVKCLGNYKNVMPTKINGGTAGFGRKILDLTREYLGDADAVAVDRHVARWACNNVGVCPTTRERKMLESRKGTVNPVLYQTISEAIRAKARECDMAPADLQVAAWMDGACAEKTYAKRRGSRERPKPLFIGRGKSVYCVRRPLAKWIGHL